MYVTQQNYISHTCAQRKVYMESGLAWYLVIDSNDKSRLRDVCIGDSELVAGKEATPDPGIILGGWIKNEEKT